MIKGFAKKNKKKKNLRAIPIAPVDFEEGREDNTTQTPVTSLPASFVPAPGGYQGRVAQTQPILFTVARGVTGELADQARRGQPIFEAYRGANFWLTIQYLGDLSGIDPSLYVQDPDPEKGGEFDGVIIAKTITLEKDNTTNSVIFPPGWGQLTYSNVEGESFEEPNRWHEIDDNKLEEAADSPVADKVPIEQLGRAEIVSQGNITDYHIVYDSENPSLSPRPDAPEWKGFPENVHQREQKWRQEQGQEVSIANLRSFTKTAKSNDMEEFFEERTKKHIDLVRKYLDRLKKHYSYDFKDEHDKSKYDEPEHEPYLYITWKHKAKNADEEYEIPDEWKEKCDEATFHHIKNNKHHPEYWDDSLTENPINKEDRDKPSGKVVDATKMPKEHILEMVADWCAMSEELENTPKKWADDNIGKRWKFTPEQKDWIYEAIDLIWDKKEAQLRGICKQAQESGWPCYHYGSPIPWTRYCPEHHKMTYRTALGDYFCSGGVGEGGHHIHMQPGLHEQTHARWNDCFPTPTLFTKKHEVYDWRKLETSPCVICVGQVKGFVKQAQVQPGQLIQNIDTPQIEIDPTIKAEIEDAVQHILAVDPSYFKGVSKIVALHSGPYGQVSSEDPSVLHLNVQRIKNDIKARFGRFDPNNPEHREMLEDAIKEALVEVITHEKGHALDWDPEHGRFPGGEGAAEQESRRMLQRVFPASIRRFTKTAAPRWTTEEKNRLKELYLKYRERGIPHHIIYKAAAVLLGKSFLAVKQKLESMYDIDEDLRPLKFEHWDKCKIDQTLQELYRSGQPINRISLPAALMYQITNHALPKAETCGFPTYYDSFDHAVASNILAVGFERDGDKLTEKPIETLEDALKYYRRKEKMAHAWNKDEIVALLQDAHTAGLPLTYSFFKSHPSIYKPLIGVERSLEGLRDSIKRNGYSWSDLVIEAAPEYVDFYTDDGKLNASTEELRIRRFLELNNIPFRVAKLEDKIAVTDPDLVELGYKHFVPDFFILDGNNETQAIVEVFGSVADSAAANTSELYREKKQAKERFYQTLPHQFIMINNNADGVDLTDEILREKFSAFLGL